MRLRVLALAILAGLAGCGEEEFVDAPPQSDPGKRAKMDVIGMTAKSSKVAIAADNRVHWFTALASETHLSAATAIPAQVSRMTPERRCDFTPPAEGSLVSVVNLSGSPVETTIFPTTEKLIADNVERLIDRSGDKMLMILGKTALVDPFEMVNLILTETSAPLHLVLSAKKQVIWNFVPAEGVKISHVTLLGQQEFGVVNLPEGVSITAHDGKMLKKCDIAPAYTPREDWKLARRSREHFDKYKLRSARFDNWLRSAHNGYSAEHKVEGLSFGHVLIGPAPRILGERVPYRGIGQGHVQVVSSVPIDVMDRRDYARKMKAIATQKAEQFVGMSLAAYGREKNKQRNN